MSTVAHATLEEVDRTEWDDLLREEGRDDAYLTRAYVEASAVVEPGEPTFLALRGSAGGGVFPIIVREIPGGGADAITPYGYGGPVTWGDPAVASRLYELYEDWARERGLVSTFIRFHPLFENHERAGGTVRVERLAATISWRLDAGRDLAAGMHQMHRRGARKAEREGVEVEVDVGARTLAEFVPLYEEAMRRLGADAFYFFSADYWDVLRSGLGERLVLLNARHDGTLVASLLLLAGPPWLHYHLGATTERGFELGASKLAFLEAARWGQASGHSELHLGTGHGSRESPLFDFKRRFAPADPLREFRIGKLVHDAEAYRALAGTDSLDGFFPAYRAGRRAGG